MNITKINVIPFGVPIKSSKASLRESPLGKATAKTIQHIIYSRNCSVVSSIFGSSL